MPKATPPAFIEPCKPQLLDRPPSGGEWWHEVKFDGYRFGARRDRDQVTFLTRGGFDWTKRLGERLADAVRALPCSSAYLDAELVVDGANGISDFSALQSALSAKRTGGFTLYVFDLMFLDGADLRPRTLLERKAALDRLLAGAAAGGPLRLSRHFDETDGAAMIAHACQLGIECVVSKRRDSGYVSGEAKVWAKAICRQRDTFLIGGYEPASGAPGLVGSLYLGQVKDGETFYRGHVGTGFSEKVARDLKVRLEAIRREGNPFADKSTAELRRRGVRFVEPRLQAEVAYRGLTEAGRLRHPSYIALREDEGTRPRRRRKP